MLRFEFIELPLNGLKLVNCLSVKDNRGFLSKLFCSNEFSSAGWQKPLKQINHTYTQKRGTIRGFHYQDMPFPEMKLIKCLKGEIWDVAIDLRSGSKTFLQSYGVKLTEKNDMALLIPEGFAHGFQTLTNNVEIFYMHTEVYYPEFEGRLNPFDPFLGIKWPIEFTNISERDSGTRMIDKSYTGVKL